MNPVSQVSREVYMGRKKWRIRKQGSSTIARIYSIHPSKGEVFYLRMLLIDALHNHSAGKKSFEDIRTVNDVLYESYKETCRELGMLNDDELWNLVMEDAKEQQLPMQMRELFVMLFVFCDLNDPSALFEKSWQSMAEDFEYQIRVVENAEPDLLKWMVLIDIKKGWKAPEMEPYFKELELSTPKWSKP